MDLVIGLVIGLIVGAGAVYFILQTKHKKDIEKGVQTLKGAEEKAHGIIEEALKDAETKKKEAKLEAQEEALKLKNEAEKEAKERRNEVARLEKRVQQKEETLDKKIEQTEKAEEKFKAKQAECDAKYEEVEALYSEQEKKLEEISGLTADEAKEYLLRKIESDVRHEAAVKIKEIEQQTKDEADEKARNIISLAIQRIASDQVAEATVSTVALPNDDMKGRIIGREGRNIKSIESITGVDLIIDDTPEAITISSFDPVRREIARLTLERLIADGRIHPSRIEEMFEKCTREVEIIIKQSGEQATFEAGVNGLSSEIIKILGRLRYRTSYGQNVLIHSIEVARIAGIMADELGVDSTLAKRAGLLHDIGKSASQEVEGSHVTLGVDIARRLGENRDVLHAIEAHHNDVEPQTVVAMLVQAADAVSAARPGARRENLETYIKRIQKLEEIANGFEGVEKTYALQAGREIRVMVKPERISDDDMTLLARDIANKIENELEYPGQIKVNLIRENRRTEFAK